MDPIADMLSQIRNAQNAQHLRLVVSHSKIKLAILEILKNHKQIADFRLLEKANKKDEDDKNEKNVHNTQHSRKKIEIDLLKNIICDFNRISSPGRRVYTNFKNIPRPKRSRAMIIVSTPKGVLEGEEARKQGLGGEIIAEVR